MSTQSVRSLADQLMRLGYCSSETDAVLVAIHLCVALEARAKQAVELPAVPPVDNVLDRPADVPGTVLLSDALVDVKAGRIPDIGELMMQRL